MRLDPPALDHGDDVRIRPALGSFGWCRELLTPWAIMCLTGIMAGVTSVRLRSVPQMPYEDFTWSIAILLAIISTTIPSALLVDRVDVLSFTAARSLWTLRLLGFLAASTLALWPAALGLVGAPRQLVVPLCAQNAFLLGLAALVIGIDSRLALAPTVVTVALAVVPGLLPMPIHPLLPTRHPEVVQLAQAVVWAVGGLLLGGRHHLRTEASRHVSQ